MRDPNGKELKRFLIAAGSDPDKLAALEELVSLLAARDEAVDDGEPAARIASLDAQVSAARDELRFRLGEME